MPDRTLEYRTAEAHEQIYIQWVLYPDEAPVLPILVHPRAPSPEVQDSPALPPIPVHMPFPLLTSTCKNDELRKKTHTYTSVKSYETIVRLHHPGPDPVTRTIEAAHMAAFDKSST